MSNVATYSCFVRPEARSKPLGPQKGENSAILEYLLKGETFNKHLFRCQMTRVVPDGTIAVEHRRVQLDP